MAAKIRAFVKREAVLCAAALAAALSALAVPPGPAYFGYVDWRVLALLFCLMAVVAGLRKAGVLEMLAQRLIVRAGSARALCLYLVLLCFFSAMLITNDVALLTFVPLAIAVLEMTGLRQRLIYVVCLQTVAANLGSMLTPVGNPQNLYLFAYYALGLGPFLAVTLPLAGAGLLLVALCCFWGRRDVVHITFAAPAAVRNKRLVCVLAVLAALCLLTVVRVLPWWAALLAVCAGLLVSDCSLFKQVDYSLLLTFLCFFVFVGNLGAMPQVRAALGGLIAGRTLPAGVVLSQFISNVPAAVMLSSFTDDWADLLRGVNLGGLGTLVASLASLISFKLYAALPGARPARYLLVFTALNAALLLALYPLAAAL